MHYTNEGRLVVRANVIEAIYEGEAPYIFDNPEYGGYIEITDEDVQEWRDFDAQFEVHDTNALNSTDFYYGQDYMFVIRRRADGAEFGIQYFHGGGKHGETMFYEERDYDDNTYTLRRVKPVTIIGYRFAKEES